MLIPRRFILCNNNPAWTLEGKSLLSVDLKELIQYTIFRDKIELLLTCTDCTEAYSNSLYPTNKINKFILSIVLSIYINKWNKYKCKIDKYTIKHSKKEVHTNIIYSPAFDMEDLNEDEEE